MTDILDWSIGQFGSAQSLEYRRALLSKCHAVAEKEFPTQSCAILLGESARPDLRFAREGRHFIVQRYRGAACEIVAFLHERTDLPSRIKKLESKD
ncbi:MAG: type II toxin-antitoxin system RelE/ParE family toxin [Sulfitobacter sp.]|nr:type II toxin-antitoxin system RelE/ParE family toxin [Sulfitobacter sp.]